MSSIEAIIFDMDNVLFDYQFERRLDQMAELTGLTPKEINRRIFASDFEEDADRGVYDLDQYIAESNRLLGSNLEFQQLLDARLAVMAPDAQMLQLVRDLRSRVKLALLTNNGQFLAAGLPQFFPEARELFGEHAYFSGLLGKSKPDPAAFLEVCGRLGAAPEQTLFVDDCANYISGAQKAGLLVHHYKDYAGLLPVLKNLTLIT